MFSAPAYHTYGGLIAREEFEPAGFAARLGIEGMRRRFLTLLAAGGGDLDWSAISTLAQRDAGL